MPVAIKDNIATHGYPTTCGSRMLEGYVSPFEASVVRRLRDAGAIVACKTNMDEFAMGASTEYSAFGRCLHPEYPDRVPGGSSGGSAALVAAQAVEAALGSETGGSVRQPAAFCGVVGYKPTYGRVSRFGLVAFGSSLDQIGVFGSNVQVTAHVAAAISGHDPWDSTSLVTGPITTPDARKDLSGLVVGVPAEYFAPDIGPGVRRACERALDAMRCAGAEVRDVSLPHTPHAVATYYVIAPAEASANLARYDGVRFGTRTPDPVHTVAELYRETRANGFGAEVKRRILVGTYVLSSGYYDAYYRKAQIARGLLVQDFSRVFAEGVHVLFTPTTPSPAFKAGEKLRDPVAMYLADRFVCSANLAGIPAISVPIGRVDGLPVGGQLLGSWGDDTTVLQSASMLESLVDGNAES